MSDPSRTTAAPDSPETQPDRDARIEALLVIGLDHFVRGQYDQAINVWTRVLFLDRNHERARAYIERARRATAERQRESDELLHRGVDAFERGDTDAAHALITRAVEQIGPTDLASALLARLTRLQAGGTATVEVAPRQLAVDPDDGMTTPVFVSRPRRVGVTVAATVAVAVGAVLVGIVVAQWTGGPPPVPDTAGALVAEPLPMVTGAELDIARARALFAGGHLRDALAALDAASRREPLRGDVVALRTEIQQRILEPRARAAATTVGGGTR